MKRRIVNLCVFVLAGAIINIAVAWGCMLHPEWTAISHGHSDFDLRVAWRRFMPRNCTPLTDLHVVYQYRSVGAASLVISGACSCDQEHVFLVYDFAGGWPAFSLRGQVWDGVELQDDEPYWLSLHEKDLLLFKGRLLDGLPLCPAWPGFAINTLFYAAILWLLFAAPGFVKRRTRIKRGLCPACAYPVGASDVCTECGKPVRLNR